MAQLEGEIIIGRPPEVVFDFVADERNEPSFNPRMVRAELVSGEPIGSGTQFRAATKSMGRLLEMTIEYTGYERPSRLDSVTHMPSAETRGTLRFEPVPAGTRMRWSWDVEPRGFVKFLAPIVTHLGRRQEQRIWASLKQHLEASEAQPS